MAILGAVRRVLASIFQIVFRDRLRDIDEKTDRLGSASVESVTYLGSEVRALDQRLARIEGELAALRELLESREGSPESAEDPVGSRRSLGRLRMEVAPGSVWLDARGTQSVAHAERGIARYVREHAQALLALAPELIGWVGLSPDVPVPEAAESLRGSEQVAWQSRRRSARRRRALPSTT